VNVYLNDLKDYDAMNKVYHGAPWGNIPPVRTTVAPQEASLVTHWLR